MFAFTTMKLNNLLQQIDDGISEDEMSVLKATKRGCTADFGHAGGGLSVRS